MKMFEINKTVNTSRWLRICFSFFCVLCAANFGCGSPIVSYNKPEPNKLPQQKRLPTTSQRDAMSFQPNVNAIRQRMRNEMRKRRSSSTSSEKSVCTTTANDRCVVCVTMPFIRLFCFHQFCALRPRLWLDQHR